MALELESVIQRFEFDISNFETNIARAQQRLAEFQRDSERAGTGQKSLERSIRSTAATTSQADRELLRLRSSLGGAERATSQLTIAERRLETAQRAGLVSTNESIRLRGLMTQTFTANAVRARDLRTNLAGLNASMLTLVSSMGRLGAMPIPPILLMQAGRLPIGGLLGGAAAVGGAAIGVSLAKAGEASILQQQRLTALGAGPEARRLLVDVAIEGGSDLEGLIDLFGKLQISARDFGATQSELIEAVQGLDAAARLQGETFSQVSGPLRQLTQALASGKPQLEELNSIMEGLPAVTRAWATELFNMGKISADSTTALRADWKNLSQEDLFGSLLAALRGLRQQVEELPKGSERSAKAVATAWADAGARIGQSTGFTQLWLDAWERIERRGVAAAKAVGDFFELAFGEATAGNVGVKITEATSQLLDAEQRLREVTGAAQAQGMEPGDVLAVQMAADQVERLAATRDALLELRDTFKQVGDSAATAGKKIQEVPVIDIHKPAGAPLPAIEETIRFGTPLQEFQRRLPGRAQPFEFSEAAEAKPFDFGPELERNRALLEENAQLMNTVQSAASDAGSQVAASFADAALSGEKLSDVLNRLIEDIAKMALQTAINIPIQAGIQEIFGAFAPGAGAAHAFGPTTQLGGAGGIPFTRFHQGGIVGQTVGSYYLPPTVRAAHSTTVPQWRRDER